MLLCREDDYATLCLAMTLCPLSGLCMPGSYCHVRNVLPLPVAVPVAVPAAVDDASWLHCCANIVKQSVNVSSWYHDLTSSSSLSLVPLSQRLLVQASPNRRLWRW